MRAHTAPLSVLMSSPKRTRSIWKRETLLAPAECERQAGGITGTSLWTSSTCEVCALNASAKPKGCTAGYHHSIHDPPHPLTAEKETNLVRSHQYKMCGLLFKVFALCQAYIGREREKAKSRLSQEQKSHPSLVPHCG